jgi:FMN phosphatase YigB (HAD superfamily)
MLQDDRLAALALGIDAVWVRRRRCGSEEEAEAGESESKRDHESRRSGMPLPITPSLIVAFP